ncbi:MAG: HEAT repeat domain-containing protein [Anaerolineae bacterium]|nr:HEAT repeat domain-containing protein [Anaerolineae bacterium]
MAVTRMSKRAKLAYLADLEEGYRPFDKHALKLLQALLQDPDAEVRAEAIACLWNDPDTRWINVLMRLATDDPHVDVRAHAVSVLGRYVYEGEQARLDDWVDVWEDEITPEDYERVTEFLFRLAHDPDEPLTVRRYAIEALAFRSGDPAVEDLIEWAYHHPDRRMKVSALFAMARHGHQRWDKYILAELHSPDAQIQYEAVRAAGELGITEATETLIELATRKGVRKPLRLLAIYALGETGDPRALPVLEKLARARDRDVRDVARDALEEWLMFNQFEEMMEAEDLEESFVGSTFPDVWDADTGTFSKN